MRDRVHTFLCLLIVLAVCAMPMAAQSTSAKIGATATVQAGHNDITIAGVHFTNVVTITARHADGTVFHQEKVHNLVTNAGFLAIAHALSDTAAQPASANYIALACDDCSGTNTATVDVGDTAISTSGTGSTEITDHGLARAQGTPAYSVGSDPKVYTVAKVFTSTTGTISANKVALLNASSSGTLYYEAAFTKVTLNGANGDTLTVTWTVTLS